MLEWLVGRNCRLIVPARHLYVDLIATPEGLQHAFFLQLLSVADSLFLSLRAILYLSHEETPSACLLKMCSILHS